MPIDERWNALTESDWDMFAAAWINDLRGASSGSDSDVGQSVVMMNFTSTAEHQWRFLSAAMNHAESDDEFGHIAAGPLEHLLSKHGEDYIALIEERAASDPKFARMVTGAWKHMMTDDIWQRVQAIQAKCPNPLTGGEPNEA